MLFSAYVEVGGEGWCTVWIGELLGFFLNEPSEEQAMDRVPYGIRAYLRWLRRHGEQVEAPRTVRVNVAERGLYS